MENFFSLTYSDLLCRLKDQDFNTRGASLLYNYLYKKGQLNFEIPNLSKQTQTWLKESFSLDVGKITKVSGEETRKFLIQFSDGLQVESVLIPFQGKYTICLSSQVGCAMKCSFCYTGTQGLKRSLKTHEIVGQVLAIKEWLNELEEKAKISNLVFMGQGEPLHNFGAVKKACEIFLDQHGLSFGREKITISTAGYLPGLQEWLVDPLSVNLALSFHCPVDEIRDELIPLNRPYPLRQVLSLIKELPLEKKRFVTFEILLIKNLNDSIEMAQKSAELIKDLCPLVNLIPFNPFPGSPYQRPGDEAITTFQEVMESYGIPTMIRKTKGDEVLAACGQLNSKVANPS